MASLNLDLDYFNHPKVIRLVGLLGNDAEVLPIRLWVYCGKFHDEDGRLAGYSEAEVERIVGWRGTPGKCGSALVLLRFLERIDDGYQVHDWIDHAGHISVFRKRGKMMRNKQLEALSGASVIVDKSETTVKASERSDAVSVAPSTAPSTAVSTATSQHQATPRQGSALHSISIQGSTEQGSAENVYPEKTGDTEMKGGSAKAKALFMNEKGYAFIYQLTDDEFITWRNRVANVLKTENDERPNNKFIWTGSTSNNEYSGDWLALNNRLFTNNDKQKFMFELKNYLDEQAWWCDCVELSIVVAARRSATVPVKSAMKFVIALLKNPAGLCADLSEGVLVNYKIVGRVRQ